MSKKRTSTAKWQRTKIKWFAVNPPIEGYYLCWLCNQLMKPEKVTLDHVADWATYPEYRYELSNLRPAHQFCNNERTSKQLDKLRARRVLCNRRKSNLQLNSR